MRVKSIRYITTLLLVSVGVYLFYLQIIRGAYYFDLSRYNSIRVISLEGRRGNIFDRRGEILAENILSFNVSVIPQDIVDKESLFSFLSRELGIDIDIIKRRYRIKRVSPFSPVVLAENIDRSKAIRIQEHVFRFPGLMIQESFQRIYPQGDVGAHVIGYVGKINQKKMQKLQQYGYSAQSVVGYSGVEEFYDQLLKGENGGRQVEVNSRGQQVRLLSIKEPQVGKDLYLTIDQRIQSMATDVLNRERGAVIIMDSSTGEVISLVSSPSYDLNDFVDPKRRNRLTMYFKNNNAPMLNRAINSSYPPGSVFKVATALAGLNSRKITQHTTFNCQGYMELGGRRFGCTHVHHDEDLIDAIKHSCNVYMYRVGLMVGANVIAQAAKDLGLGQKTEIDLPYEEEGSVPSRLIKQRWYKGDTLNMSIGQGDVLTTPMQLVRMMAAMGNGGFLVKPYVKRHDSGQPVFLKKVPVNDEFINIVNLGLRRVVKDYSGTAHILETEGLSIYGKTGTAQAGGSQKHHAWFAGYIKIPSKGGKEYAGKTLSFCVFLENGGSSHNAVLATRQLLFRMQAKDMI